MSYSHQSHLSLSLDFFIHVENIIAHRQPVYLHIFPSSIGLAVYWIFYISLLMKSPDSQQEGVLLKVLVME
jgi:hypothetical protein